jgi:hypothetical protein
MHTTQNHELPSFSGYLRKVFHFRKAVASLRDGRQDPEISPQTVFLALFHGFVFRLSSFLQLEADLAQPHLQHCTEAPRAFGDDVLRYSLASFALRHPVAGDLVITLKQENRTAAYPTINSPKSTATTWSGP